MEKYIYKIDNDVFHSQAELAWALNLNRITVRSKIHRAGGKNKINKITMNGYDVEVVKTFVQKLV